MGDNGDKIIGQDKTQKEEPKKIQLAITLLPDGRINVVGPIHDRLLCYGLLKGAEEVIGDLRFAKKIEVPNQHGILNFARKLKI